MRRSTTAHFAHVSRRRGKPAAIWGWACAMWSSRPPTARVSTRPRAFRVRDTRQAGSVSNRAGSSMHRWVSGRAGRAMKAQWRTRWPKASACHPSSVRIHMGHTDVAPIRDGQPRRTQRHGGRRRAVPVRARRTRKVLAIAAGCLDLPDAESLRLIDARIERRNGDEWIDTGLTLADVARRAYMDPTRCRKASRRASSFT